jgi:hypothetical protein
MAHLLPQDAISPSGVALVTALPLARSGLNILADAHFAPFPFPLGPPTSRPAAHSRRSPSPSVYPSFEPSVTRFPPLNVAHSFATIPAKRKSLHFLPHSFGTANEQAHNFTPISLTTEAICLCPIKPQVSSTMDGPGQEGKPTARTRVGLESKAANQPEHRQIKISALQDLQK